MEQLSLFDSLIIKLIEQYNQLKASKLHQIFVGKRTAFTMYDVSKHQVEAYFGIYSSLQLNDLKQQLTKLVQNAILQRDHDLYSLTDPRRFHSIELDQKIFIRPCQLHLIVPPAHDELKWGFQLLMQIVSHQLAATRLISPCTNNVLVQQKCKQWLQTHKPKLPFYQAVAKELYSYCQTQFEWGNIVLLSSLSSDQFSGMTSHQVCSQLNLPNNAYPFLSLLVWRNLFAQLFYHPKEYPLLHNWLQFQLARTRLVTTSAHNSYSLLKKGDTIDQIATKRHLKHSTITEHFIEVALVHPDASFEHLLAGKETVTLNDQVLLNMNYQTFTEQYKQRPTDSFLYYRLLQIAALKRKQEQYGA